MIRADELCDFVLARSIAMREGGEQMATYASGLKKLKECALRCYWDRVDPIDDESNQWFMVAAIGDATHELIQDMFKRAGIWRGDEVRGSSREFNVSYRQDLLIADPLNGGAVVPVEIKSVNLKKFQRALREPLEEHVLQLQAYLAFHRPEPYPYGYLFYCCRDQGEMMAYRIDYDPDIREWIEQACLELEMAVAERRAPEGNPSEWNCAYCAYKERCEGRL
jgi:CRISPR/Cas system-associated exonuclease Cas4 (RecB family)